MKKLHSIAIHALVVPALTLAAGAALAQPPTTTSDNAQEQRTTPEQRERTMPEHAQKHAQKSAMAHGTYLSNQPANAFRSDELIGSDLKSRPDSETIGTISDLLIDQDGQVVAVIVEVGGFLGLGEKEVAISWDGVERSKNTSNDGYVLTVSATREALTKAPEYPEVAGK